MSIFDIESDIRIAETLSADFYTNPSYFESSKSKIFARSWQPAALEQLTSAIEPVTLLDGFLDEPLVITRTADRVHCLSNVCTHRGMIVAEDCRSAANGLRCRYHGRRFGLDGTFLSMPEFDDALNFPSNADNLRLFESEAWSGLRFVALDPAAPFGEFFGPAVEISSRLYSAPLKFAGNRDYDVNAHWALYCENYLEGFHVPFVHPELNRAIDFECIRDADVSVFEPADGEVRRRLFRQFGCGVLFFRLSEYDVQLLSVGTFRKCRQTAHTGTNKSDVY